jgi:hypothetical protein
MKTSHTNEEDPYPKMLENSTHTSDNVEHNPVTIKLVWNTRLKQQYSHLLMAGTYIIWY